MVVILICIDFKITCYYYHHYYHGPTVVDKNRFNILIFLCKVILLVIFFIEIFFSILEITVFDHFNVNVFSLM